MPNIAPASVECLRVLVVDDDKDTADSFAQLIALWGFAPRAAYDGQMALELLPAFRPHVVLVDLEMPQPDGYEVRRRIRIAAGEQIPVIAISGHGQQAVRERSLIEGFFCHLLKPVEPLRLQALLALLHANRADKLSSEAADTVK